MNNGIPLTHDQKLSAAKEYLRSRGKYLMEHAWQPTDARHTDVSKTFAETGWVAPSTTRKPAENAQ